MKSFVAVLALVVVAAAEISHLYKPLEADIGVAEQYQYHVPDKDLVVLDNIGKDDHHPTPPAPQPSPEYIALEYIATPKEELLKQFEFKH